MPVHPPLLYLRDDGLRLVLRGLKATHIDRLSVPLLCPETLLLSAQIIPYHLIGCAENISLRAVVLLKLHHLRPRKLRLKVQDIIDIGPAKFIDRLVIIPHHTEIFILSCKQRDEPELRRIRVLILIDHNIAKALLILHEHLGAVLKELHRLHDEIIKIQCVVSAKIILIAEIALRDLLLHIATSLL